MQATCLLDRVTKLLGQRPRQRVYLVLISPRIPPLRVIPLTEWGHGGDRFENDQRARHGVSKRRLLSDDPDWMA